MELAAAGISVQPFRTHSQPLLVVSYVSQTAALDFIRQTDAHPRGLGVLQGPALSGKSTIIHHFLGSQKDDANRVIIDGRGLDGGQFLNRILQQLEFDVELGSANEALNMLRVYAMQQAAAHRAPLIIIENTDALHADALKVVCDLAALQVGRKSAVRLLLCSDYSLSNLVDAPAMQVIRDRLTGTFNLAPMEDEEVTIYLHSKLRAGGCDKPDAVLPESVCTTVFEASGGWPGIVDRLMLLALARARRCPLTSSLFEKPTIPQMTGTAGLQAVYSNHDGDSARLFLTYHGRTVREIPLDAERVMIGRSEHNDISISSRFISRHHSLFIRDGSVTLLMDLNSTNGTFVNSQRVSNYIMVHDDVVTIGHHGLKFVDPSARNRQPLEGASFSDTVIMKSIDDMRRMLARENTMSLDLNEPGKTAE